MSERTIAAICKEFNISRDWLETGEGNIFAEECETTLHVKDSAALRSLLSGWSKLDEHNQGIFLKLMESFVQAYQDANDNKE